MDPTTQFNQLLNQLPHLSPGEKILAQTIFALSSTDVKLEMSQFYSQQLIDHQKALDTYNQKMQVIRHRFLESLHSPTTQPATHQVNQDQ